LIMVKMAVEKTTNDVSAVLGKREDFLWKSKRFNLKMPTPKFHSNHSNRNWHFGGNLLLHIFV